MAKSKLSSLVKLAAKYGPIIYPIIKKMMNKRKSSQIAKNLSKQQ